MKLITELYDDVEHVLEEGTGDKKDLYIKGIFAQANIVNRNKRNYPKAHMESAIREYVENYVNKNAALGELNHPQRMQVDPERACMLIKEMYWDGNNVIGKAKVLSEGVGRVVRGLILDGVRVGVSTRGGASVSLREGITYVGPDLRFSAVDVVTDPSGPDCFVNGIMEGVEWICESGVWRMETIEQARDKIIETPAAKIPQMTIEVWESFLGKLQHIK
jgi:hypothetical protein